MERLLRWTLVPIWVAGLITLTWQEFAVAAAAVVPWAVVASGARRER